MKKIKLVPFVKRQHRKMSRAILACFFLFQNAFLFAQTPFLISAGSAGNDECYGIATSSAGEVWTCGYYSSSAKFGSLVVSSSGSADVFVAHQDVNGNFDWAFHGGGAFFDRAYDVDIDASGNSFITGVFSGTVEFGSQTLVTADTTQDIFVVKLSPTGSLIWAKQFGGIGNDLALCIDVNDFGSCVVGGQFRGVSTFGSNTFTSALNNITNELSYDLFILRLDNFGNVVWAQQGSSSYDDRVMQVQFGNVGEVYAVGQFSDTLLLDVSHPYVGYNFSFIAKFSSSGIEQWFHPLFALQVTPRALNYVLNTVIITGEYQGTIFFDGSQMSGCNSTYPNKCFLLHLDAQGQLLNSKDFGSDNFISVASSKTNFSGELWVTGNFKKSLTEFSSLTGNGVFNSAGFRDIYYAKFSNNLSLLEYKHVGGPDDDVVSDMTVGISSPFSPILCGSFSSNFNVPNNLSMVTNTTNHDSSNFGPNQPWNYCNDPFYRKYQSVYSNGFREIFVTRPYIAGRLTYDFFDRTFSATCDQDTIIPEFKFTSDSIVGCDSVCLEWLLKTGQDGVIGPAYTYLWSTGETDDTIAVYTSGWVYCVLSYKDGWRTFVDSIFVTINLTPPIPTATAINAQQAIATPFNQCKDKVLYLSNSIAYLFCDNNPPGTIVNWFTPGGLMVGDTIQLGLAGVYTCQISDSNALCFQQTCYEVYIYDSTSGNCIPTNYTPNLIFEEPLYQSTDTVRLCPDDYFVMRLVDSVSFFNGLPDPVVPAFVNWSFTGPISLADSGSMKTFVFHRNFFKVTGTGNASVVAEIINPFGGAVLSTITRNFNVEGFLPPPPDAVISGPASICPDDTVLLTVSPSRQYAFMQSGIVSSNSNMDSMMVNLPGSYNSYYTLVDPITGCKKEYLVWFTLPLTAVPMINAFPANGLICPNDSMLLVADTGLNYTWFGPAGTPLSTNDSLWVITPGLYYYTFSNMDGCNLSSAPFEVFGYSTPYLTVANSPVICDGDSVVIELRSNAGSLITWLPPLSGSGLFQTVTQPGIYQCQVFSCNILTSISIEIIPSPGVAPIHIIGSSIICPNDTVRLVGPSGMSIYNWQPSGISSQQIMVFTAGTYFLNVVDIYGCPFADSVHIDTITRPAAPLTLNDLICKGNTATLTANASSQIYWFDQAIPAFPLDSGNTYITPALTVTTLYYAAIFDGTCFSPSTPAYVFIDPVSELQMIVGDSTLCPSDSLILSVPLFVGATYLWTTPKGSFTSPQIVFSNIDSTYSGIYTVVISNTECTGPPAQIQITVRDSPQFWVVVSNPFICQGDTVQLIISSGALNPVWNNGLSNDTSISVINQGDYYYTAVDLNGCIASSDTINLTIAPLLVLPSVTFNSPTCWYDTLSANVDIVNSGYIYSWQLGTDTTIVNSLLNYPLENGFYTGVVQLVVSDSFGCEGVFPFTILPFAQPNTQIVGSNVLCFGDSTTLNVQPNTFSTSSWLLNNGQYVFNSSLFLNNVSQTDAGSYYFIGEYANGCRDTMPFQVVVYTEPNVSLGADTQLCIGSSLPLTFDLPGGNSFVWSNGGFGKSITIYESDTLSVFAYYGAGCILADTIIVEFIDCNYSIPNVFSPNGDGVNEEFYIHFPSAKFGQLTIFNRWGDLIREISAQQPMWNGKGSNGEKVAEGTYFFVANYLDFYSQSVKIKGHITLVR